MGEVRELPSRCRCKGDGATWADWSECPIHDGESSPQGQAVARTYQEGVARAREVAGPRPDDDLVDERLEPGVEYTVRAHCVGHPLGTMGRGSGCGWTGTATRTSDTMPSCPNCGGWAEPDAPQGGLRPV
jgi:hypothetical protein